MKTTPRILQWLALLALLGTLNNGLSTALAQGTAFSYQGRLNAGGDPANGIYDLRFTVYDAVTNGNAVSGVLTNAATPVANGLFSVALDFGAGVFSGADRWLEVGVRANGAGPFTALAPRQAILSAPYTVMAGSASNLLGSLPAAQLSGTVPVAQLPAAVVTNGAAGLTLIGNFGGTFSGYGGGLAGINGSSIQSGTIGSAQLAPGVVGVPSGTLVLSQTAGNTALTAAGFAPLVAPGASWARATSAAPWGGRVASGAVALNGQIWVLGGFSFFAMGPTNDVWSSSNGVSWTCLTNTAPWSARGGFGAVAFNGQMWVLGGSASASVTNDVWSSSDGVTWTCVTNAAPWTARSGFGAVALNGQMWVLGGATNDVWSSSDGLTWTCVTNAAPWSPRSGFGAVACNGRLWVLGGSTDLYGMALVNDVWSSSDGLNWTQVTAGAQWAARSGLQVLALNGQITVLGGAAGGTLDNDVWSSSDGATWTCVASAAQWSARSVGGAVVLNGQMWLLGGQGPGAASDVWYSQNNSMLGGVLFVPETVSGL
jgi:hypothetical protein